MPLKKVCQLQKMDVMMSRLRGVFRKIPDMVDPDLLRPAFRTRFARLQSHQTREAFQYFDKTDRLSIDRTPYDSSHKVHCDPCRRTEHRNGSVTDVHQMLGLPGCIRTSRSWDLSPLRSSASPMAPPRMIVRERSAPTSSRHSAVNIRIVLSSFSRMGWCQRDHTGRAVTQRCKNERCSRQDPSHMATCI